MDEQERLRRLRTYGFATSGHLERPTSSQTSAAKPRPGGPLDDPDAVSAFAAWHEAASTSRGAMAAPGVLAWMRASWGFRLGIGLLVAGLAAGLVYVAGPPLPGPLEDLAVTFWALTASPFAYSLWIAVAVLAPPAPFRTGLLLGLLGAAAFTLLSVVSAGGDLGGSGASLVAFWLVSPVVASLVIGIEGWIVRRVFMAPEARRSIRERTRLEDPRRPWPALVVAVAASSLALVALTDQDTEWVFAAAYAASVTTAVIAGGLAVQRRYPERRTPVVVVGLFAGVVAGLAMLQAIWAESRWPERRRSSDGLAIGVSVVLVVLATYASYGGVVAGEADASPGTREFVVVPAEGEEPAAADVELAAAILEDRLEAIEVSADALVGDDGRITVLVAQDTDEAVLERVLGTVGVVEFRPVPPGCIDVVVEHEPMPACLARSEPLLDGTEISMVRSDADEATGETILYVEMTETGAMLFDAHAAAHLGEAFAIVLDGIVVSAPTINAPHFGGSAQVSGDFSAEDTAALVSALAAGRSLPYATSLTSADD